MKKLVYAFLFTDIEGSTRRWEEQPEDMSADLRRHNDILTRVVETNGGRVFKMVGDAVYAVFETTGAAIQAAFDGQLSLSRVSWKVAEGIQVRMAIHRGEVETEDGNGDFFGPTLNEIARLLSSSHGGQVVLSAETVTEAALPPGSVKNLGSHVLKSLGKPMAIYQLMHPKLRADFPELLSLRNQPNPTVKGLNARVFPCFPVAVQVVAVNSDERILLLSHKTRGAQVISGGMEAHESVLQAALRETAEEAGFAVRVRPLGVVHASSFTYDRQIKYMLDVYFVMAYEGGRVVPGDDMAGSEVLWRSVDEIIEQRIEIVIPPNGISILNRAVELWRLWKDASTYPLEPWLSDQSFAGEPTP